MLAWGVPAALVVFACLRVEKPNNGFTRFLVRIGDASYALYLTHVFVMIGYGWLLKSELIARQNQIPLVVIVVGIAVAIGLSTHLLVERPLTQLIRRLGAGSVGKTRRRTVETASAGAG